MAIEPEVLRDELVLLNETNPDFSVQQLADAFVEHHPEQDVNEAAELLIGLRRPVRGST